MWTSPLIGGTGAHLDPLSEIILLSLQLDAHLVGAQHLLLGY